MNFSVVAFSGKAQAGKTESAKALKKLIETYPGYKAEILPFASKLKDIAKEVYGWDGSKEMFYKETVTFANGEAKEERTLIEDQGRQLLVNVGKVLRSIRPTVWADYTCNKILKEIADGSAFGKIYIIDDLRYRNEANTLGHFGNKVIMARVFRDLEEKLDIESETDLDNYGRWQYKLDNNGDLEDLSKSLETVASEAIKNACRS